MKTMRAMDAAFLAMEKPDEPRHLGSVSIFGPGDRGPLTYEVVRNLLTERLPLIASARRVVVEVPLGLGRPSWATDRRFDLEFHLRHTAVPASGGMKALGDFIARTHARPLDRSRPLWELWVIEGLPDQRVALYAKIHMAALDDVTGAEVMTALLDPDPDAIVHVQPHSGHEDDDRNDPVQRFFGALPDQWRLATRFPRRLVGRAMNTVGSSLAGMGDTITETIHRTPGMEAVARFLPQPSEDEVVEDRATGRAPMLSWNGPTTGRRRFAMTTLPLDTIVEIKRRTGTTVNDVVVAVVAGAVRDWLDRHDELPTSPTIALVPLLVGGGDSADAHVAGLVVPLPTNTADPAERLRRASEALKIAKQKRSAVPASLMQDVSLFAPPAVAALAGRLVGGMPHRSFASPTVNLAITNVPGSRQPMYLAGRPLEANYPVLTINDLTPVHIGLQSSPGAINVGALSCRDTLDDLAPLVARLDVELGLLDRATRPATPANQARPARQPRSKPTATKPTASNGRKSTKSRSTGRPT
jgi:WS/DGAT/MGAT family acyltransferase